MRLNLTGHILGMLGHRIQIRTKNLKIMRKANEALDGLR